MYNLTWNFTNQGNLWVGLETTFEMYNKMWISIYWRGLNDKSKRRKTILIKGILTQLWGYETKGRYLELGSKIVVSISGAEILFPDTI